MAKKKSAASAYALVGEEGLEPSRLAPLVPKTSVSTSSTTRPNLLQHFTDRAAKSKQKNIFDLKARKV